MTVPLCPASPPATPPVRLCGAPCDLPNSAAHLLFMEFTVNYLDG
jgi:hypothetical protein